MRAWNSNAPREAARRVDGLQGTIGYFTPATTLEPVTSMKIGLL